MDLQPHIQISSDCGAKYAILPGDPKRVDKIANFFDNPTNLAFNREYKSIVGEYKGVRILAISTGIGAPSTTICLEELKSIGITTAIRTGSCGALKKDITLGELILANGAVRNDGTSDQYIEKGYPALPDFQLLYTIIETATQMELPHWVGKVRSHDGFYIDTQPTIDTFWANTDVIGSEMETSALYVVGALRGLKVASILNVVVEWGDKLEEGICNYVNHAISTEVGETNEIKLALESIIKMNKVVNHG